MALSPREQRILAGIERRLSEQDPGLAARLTRSGTGPLLLWWLSVRIGHALLLALVLAGLVGLHSIVAGLGPRVRRRQTPCAPTG